MPYIKKERRHQIAIHGISEVSNAGELNYFITNSILEWWDETVPNYADYNEVIGVLECCKLELYRKLISKYENKKCEEHGEVF